MTISTALCKRSSIVGMEIAVEGEFTEAGTRPRISENEKTKKSRKFAQQRDCYQCAALIADSPRVTNDDGGGDRISFQRVLLE